MGRRLAKYAFCQNGCEQSEQASPYSITSSARAISVGGRSSPIALAVVRLMRLIFFFSPFQYLPRVQFDSLKSPVGGHIDLMRRAAPTIGITFGIVESDQRKVPRLRCKRVEHHPKIIPLPDIVVFFIRKPAWQFFGIRQDAQRQMLTKLTVALDPYRPAAIDRLDLELGLGQRQVEMRGNPQ